MEKTLPSSEILPVEEEGVPNFFHASTCTLQQRLGSQWIDLDVPVRNHKTDLGFRGGFKGLSGHGISRLETS
jgi:hypothetical protein